MEYNFNIPTELYILLKTLAFPLPSGFGSETGFPLWGEEKAQIRVFFFRAQCFPFFCALFSSRNSHSFFGITLTYLPIYSNVSSLYVFLCPDLSLPLCLPQNHVKKHSGSHFVLALPPT
jgi:hypothetical protein